MYLETAFQDRDGAWVRRERSDGILIRGEEIVAIEFLHNTEQEPSDEAEPSTNHEMIEQSTPMPKKVREKANKSEAADKGNEDENKENDEEENEEEGEEEEGEEPKDEEQVHEEKDSLSKSD